MATSHNIFAESPIERLDMYFVSAGVTNVNIEGDSDGTNTVIARCSNATSNTVLSRSTFLANIGETTLERINIDKNTATITALLLYLSGGDNSVHFDDTIGPIEIVGGPEADSFYFGQIYNGERNETYGVSTSDPIATTLTSKGFVSDGCASSHSVSVKGGDGNDVSNSLVYVVVVAAITSCHSTSFSLSFFLSLSLSLVACDGSSGILYVLF